MTEVHETAGARRKLIWFSLFWAFVGFVVVLVWIIPSPDPVAKLTEACKREFAHNEARASDCILRNLSGIISDIDRQKMERARRASGL